MKRIFPKFLSMLLVVNMLISLIQIPAFAAAPAFRDTEYASGHKYYLAPYGDELVHLDFYAEGAASYTANNGGNMVTIDNNGIVSINSSYVNKGSNNISISATAADGSSVNSGNFNPHGYPIGYKVNGTSVGENNKFDIPFIHDFTPNTYCLSNGLIYNRNSFTMVSGTTSGTSGYAFTVPTSVAVFENADVTSDASGNGYMIEAANKDFIGFRPHYANTSSFRIFHSSVMQFDVKLSSEKDFNIAFVSSDNSILKWNHAENELENLTRYSNKGSTVTLPASVEPGWHTVKFMFDLTRKVSGTNPYRVNYQRGALFFDDQLVVKDFELPALSIYNGNPLKTTTTPNNVIRFEGSAGIDNFKYYGSSTPHAYNVGLDSAPKSGSTVGGLAQSYSFFSAAECDTASTTYEYTYYVSDTVDSSGSYTKITSKNTSSPIYINSRGKLVINSDCTGRYIKIGARACYRGGKSPEVMSEEVYEIQGYGGLFVKPYIIYDAETDGAISRVYTKYYDNPRGVVTIGGKKGTPWGPKNAGSFNPDKIPDTVTNKASILAQWENYGDFINRPGNTNVNGDTSIPMAKYQNLVIEVYSAKNTNQSFLCRLYEGTNGGKFYKAGFNANWEGEWRQIRLPIAGGLDDCGAFTSSSSLSFKPYEAKMLQLQIGASASSPFYPDTEVYIGKIYLEGEREEQLVANENGEIILPDNYNPDTMTDYVSMVKEKHPNNHHPRLLVTDNILERIKQYKDTDPFMKKAYDTVKAKADAYLNEAPTAPYYMNSTGTAYQFNRTIESVAQYCGMMYLLTGNEEYAERMWAEAQNMMNSDRLWHDTTTGLDSAHIANGMALIYDWCYYYLDKDQKLAIRNAVMINAFDNAMKIRNGGGYMTSQNNVVAANSKGYMTAMLAICDESGYEYLANEYINSVIKYLPENLMFQFMPDGNYSEGITYWQYTVNALMVMTNSMITAIGSDGGLQSQPGLAETCYFPFAMRGPMGAFNHSDAGENALAAGAPMYHYLAERYNAPALRAYRLDTYDDYNNIEMEDLLWYNPELPFNTDWVSQLSKDYFLDGLEPVISFRSVYGTSANFIAAKGGNNMTGHDQPDAGTYVLDALGVRWIGDTGSGVYNVNAPDYCYYRNRTEAHNCIVFDPERGWTNGGGQTVAQNRYDTLCPIVDSGAAAGAAFSVIDLQPCYTETVNTYKRGFALINNRTQFVVRDEFSAKEPFELYSYFHTSKKIVGSNGIITSHGNDITICPDGKSLIMKNSRNNQMCKVDFITNFEFELGVMDAVPHSASPVPDSDQVQDRPADKMHKFYLRADDVQNGTITVVFTPLTQGTSVALPQIKDLSDFDEYLQNSTVVAPYNIRVDSVSGNKVNITTNGAAAGTKKLILASYKGKILVNVKIVSVTFTKGTNTHTVTGFDPGTHDTIKAFVWDDVSSTLKPISPSK